MFLTLDNSICERNQAIVVSKDRGNQREHRATNPQRKFELVYAVLINARELLITSTLQLILASIIIILILKYR